MEPRLWLPQTHKGAVFNHTEYPGFVIHTSLCPKTHTHSPVHTHTHTRHTYESPHHVHACTTPPHAHTHTSLHTQYTCTQTHMHTHTNLITHTLMHTHLFCLPALTPCCSPMIFTWPCGVRTPMQSQGRRLHGLNLLGVPHVTRTLSHQLASALLQEDRGICAFEMQSGLSTVLQGRSRSGKVAHLLGPGPGSMSHQPTLERPYPPALLSPQVHLSTCSFSFPGKVDGEANFL